MYGLINDGNFTVLIKNYHMFILEYIGIGAALILIGSIVITIFILMIQYTFPNYTPKSKILNISKNICEKATVYSLITIIIFMIIVGTYQIIKPFI